MSREGADLLEALGVPAFKIGSIAADQGWSLLPGVHGGGTVELTGL